MCRWMGSHFHDWIDYKGIAFSLVTRMGSHIFGIWGVRIFCQVGPDLRYKYESKVHVQYVSIHFKMT